jgi:hypothetical protein
MVVRLPVQICHNVRMVAQSPDLFKRVAVINVDEMDAALLGAALLPRVRSRQKLPPVAEFQTAYASD